ncbi:MAG: serine protease Do, partial [Verrucomicrobiales bacterium]
MRPRLRCWLLIFAWMVGPFQAFSDEPPSPAHLSIEELVDQIRPSLVTVLQIGREGGEQGIGSGFVIDESGLIATNLHVIGEGRRVRVRLADGREPTVIAVHAWDRKMDLAILRVEAEGLQRLELSTAESVNQGVETLALGNPEGLEFSVTRGVVSGVRDVNGIEMIQAAVPI